MIAQSFVTPRVSQELLANGFALIRCAIDPAEARTLRALYDRDSLFRSRIVMERHSFGRGEYKYFADPVPPRVAQLRAELYEELLPVANEWMLRLGKTLEFPPTHQAFLHECLAGEQSRPTALLLRYRAGDYNRLHQDLYGPVAFPLQATFYLSQAGAEFGGGEVVLGEQKPRAQTRVHVLTPDQGDLLIFPTSAAPIAGANGSQRVVFRHGIATVTRGERFSLGIVLHDAR
ncbi:MAG: 2OG-Fe(II) oxygenase [Candidatus Eremiobacteraeota bacterium]|nr:2OG-Fe(II) oxygenase [Candidatus Eremiobacteraeota bacterium]